MNQSTFHSSQSKSGKSPFAAALLGFLLPGAGQVYCGQDNKGVFLIGLFLLGHWATGGISSLLLCPTISADAFMIAGKFNRGEPVRRWEFFPAIKWLNALQPRVIPLGIFILLAAITLIRVVLYGSDYRPGE